MPAQTALVVTGIVIAFGGFALILAFADYYTHAGRKS